jgi:hypothetical protein
MNLCIFVGVVVVIVVKNLAGGDQLGAEAEVKGTDIPVTGRGGPWGCERSRLPHYLDKQLTDGGKLVSPTRRPSFTPRFLFLKFLVLISVRG